MRGGIERDIEEIESVLRDNGWKFHSPNSVQRWWYKGDVKLALEAWSQSIAYQYHALEFSVKLSCCFIVHDNPPKLQINEDAGGIYMEITL